MLWLKTWRGLRFRIRAEARMQVWRLEWSETPAAQATRTMRRAIGDVMEPEYPPPPWVSQPQSVSPRGIADIPMAELMEIPLDIQMAAAIQMAATTEISRRLNFPLQTAVASSLETAAIIPKNIPATWTALCETRPATLLVWQILHQE